MTSFFGIEQNKTTGYLNNQRFEMSFCHKFSRYKGSTPSKDFSHCSHTFHNISVGYLIPNFSRRSQHTAWGVPEIRSPKKNYITCHTLSCLLYEQNASKKSIPDKSTIMPIACTYHHVSSLSLCFFYFLPRTSNPTPTPDSFPDP